MGETSLNETAQGLKNSSIGKWFSTLKSEIEKNSLESNVVGSVVLAGLEKLVETEFACPCDPKLNSLFASAFFFLPPLMASILYISGNRKCEGFIFIFFQSMWWLILLFFDGKYLACAKTDWPGRFVIIDKAAPLKWCEPTNRNSSQELMIKTQRWVFISQGIGMSLLPVTVILFAVYKWCCKCATKEEQVQGEHGSHHLQGKNEEDSPQETSVRLLAKCDDQHANMAAMAVLTCDDVEQV